MRLIEMRGAKALQAMCDMTRRSSWTQQLMRLACITRFSIRPLPAHCGRNYKVTGTADKRWVDCPFCGANLPLRLDGKLPVHSHGKMTVVPVAGIPVYCDGSNVSFDDIGYQSTPSAEVNDVPKV